MNTSARHHLLHVLLVAAAGSVASAQVGVSVRTADTQTLAGQLKSFSFNKGLILDGKTPLPAPEVVTIFTPATDEKPGQVRFSQKKLRCDLVGGDRLFGRIEAGDDEAITLATRVLGQVRIGLDRFCAVVTPAGRRPEFDETVGQLLHAPPADDDVLLLANGDRLTGLIARIEPGHVALDHQGQSLQIPMKRIAAIRFAETDAKPPAQLRARLTLTDQSVITVDDLQWAGPHVQARLADTLITCDAEGLIRLELLGGRWVWLSQLDPISFQHTPAFSLAWPWRRDRNVIGGPIRLANQSFDRGIGVHAETVLIYQLAGAYERFVAQVGIDDDAGPLADVDVEVRVDNEIRFRAEHLRIGQRPGCIDIPLQAAKRLELIVRVGQNADIQDRVNFADAALIRKKPSR